MRIELASPDDLPEDVKASFAKYPLNITLVCAQAKTMYPGYRKMTQAMFSELAIPHEEREMFALSALALVDGYYPWVQHVAIAQSLGMAQEKIDAIERLAFDDAVFNDRERAILGFARQVVASVEVDDATFDALAAHYDSRQIVEAIFVICNYMMLPRFSGIARLSVDSVAGAAIAHAAVEHVANRDAAPGA